MEVRDTHSSTTDCTLLLNSEKLPKHFPMGSSFVSLKGKPIALSGVVRLLNGRVFLVPSFDAGL